jgi:hypothetical protein
MEGKKEAIELLKSFDLFRMLRNEIDKNADELEYK